MGRLFLVITLLCASTAAGVTWSQIQKLREYREADIALGDSFHDVAVTKLQNLLDRKDLDEGADLNLRARLGEALVRSGRSQAALDILTSSGPKSLTWRAHAYTQLGELEKASSTLKNLKTATAVYQRALIFSALGESEKALTLLAPYDKGTSAEQILALSILLDLGKIEEAEPLLQKRLTESSNQTPITRFLAARLQLLKKDRLPAIGSFQALVSANTEEINLPAPYIYAAHLGLADSLALDGNFKEATTSLIATLEESPDFPRMTEVFARLEAWRSEIDPKILKPWILPQTISPSPTTEESPALEKLPLRAAHTLYLLALINLDADQASEAQIHLSRLRENSPPEAAELNERALIQTGLIFLKTEKYESALETFELARTQASSSRVQATANALKATAAFALQDPKQALKAYEAARDLASKLQDQSLADAASFNAGVAALQAGRSPDIKDLPSLSTERLKLERSLILADQRNPQSIPLLESFLKTNPDSPRRQEAALALAENYHPTVENQATQAKTLLNQLSFDEATQKDLEARKVLALLSLGEGFDEAQQFIGRNLDHPRAPELLFKQGQALMKAESGEAILSFERLRERFPDHPLAETARFLSARASFSVNTESDIARAIERYHEIIKAGGPLATAAALDLARLQIDHSQQEAALVEIERLLKNKKLSTHDRRRLLVLGAEAASQNAHYDQALGFYNQLLGQKELPVAWFNRASFLRGRVLENLGRQNDALKTYYQVVLNNLEPEKMGPLEWQWHDKCALIGALPLLERNNEWKAALALALRVAQSGGPSATQAEERARKIKFEQMIFDEKE